MFWLVTLLMLLTAVAFVLVPLLTAQRRDIVHQPDRTASNLALYQERMVEWQEEMASGSLDGIEYDALVRELQRTLLRDARQGGEPGVMRSADASSATGSEQSGKATGADSRKPRLISATLLVPMILALLLPVAAYSLYYRWGYYDDIQLSGLLKRAIHPVNDPRETSALIQELKSAVEKYPKNQWAWYFLGRSYARLGLHEQAGSAYLAALPYIENDADRVVAMSQYVLAGFLAAGRRMTEDVRAMADRVLELDPDEQTVLRILATEAREREDYGTAIDFWQRLVYASPNSSAAKVYRSNIAAARQILLERGESLNSPPGAGGKSSVVRVSIALAEGLELPGEHQVFVAARDALKSGMPPLAVARLSVADLPATVVLDDTSSVGPFNLSSAQEVIVTALVSEKGVANPQRGDYRVQSTVFEPGAGLPVVSLEIAEQVQ